MIIEFHNPTVISDRFINQVRKEIMKISHYDKDIARAEVTMREINSNGHDRRSCEIRLDIPGDTIMVNKITADFKESATQALKELRSLLRKRKKDLRSIPTTITSTIRVD